MTESKRIVSSDELIIEDFSKHIDDWKISRIHKKQIYESSKLSLFKNDFTIKTEERDIQISKPFEEIQLLSSKSIQKHKERSYKYIHIGLVLVGIKPLTREGLDTSILAVLRDARFVNFSDSLLGTVESSLNKGPVSFSCYPNITVSLNEKMF